MKWIIVICFLMMLYTGQAKKLSRCQLVKELRKYGFSESKMRDWVCLVEHESGRRTNIVSKRNPDGSRDHGLFQINDKYWCGTNGKPGRGCNVTCKQIQTANISKAAACAKRIYRREGLDAWDGWKNHCKGKFLPNIGTCRK